MSLLVARGPTTGPVASGDGLPRVRYGRYDGPGLRDPLLSRGVSGYPIGTTHPGYRGGGKYADESRVETRSRISLLPVSSLTLGTLFTFPVVSGAPQPRPRKPPTRAECDSGLL